MAAPNIVNVATIVGMTTVVELNSTDPITLLENDNASGKVYKVNLVRACNIDGATGCDITMTYTCNISVGAATTAHLASTIVVPKDTAFTIIGRDDSFYMEENTALKAQASAANDITMTVSYDDIS
tara:strand:- start:495 stop:872 length:378 start_codon:yes stop_codon:yes gene_type:complete